MAVGLGLMILGMARFLEGGLPISQVWPYFVLAFAFAQLVHPDRTAGRRPRRRAGVTLLYVGLWGFIVVNGIFGMGYGDGWPLLLIGIGASIVWHSVEGPDADIVNRVPRT